MTGTLFSLESLLLIIVSFIIHKEFLCFHFYNISGTIKTQLEMHITTKAS